MPAQTIKIRSAIQTDIDNINHVIETAIMGWDLPERVKRLSLPSYRYTLPDFDHFEFKVAEDEQQKIVAVAAWEEADLKETPGQQSGLLLHGLYVYPAAQHQGLGSALFNAVENFATEKCLDGILVKAQKDATVFFKKMDMQRLIANNPDKDYKNRFWKSLHKAE